MKIYKVLTAAVAAILLSVSAYAQDYNAVAEKYNQATEMVAAKQFAEAIPLLEQVISEGLAVGDEALGVVSDAQKLLPRCYFQLGGRYFQAKDMDQAISIFEKAAELSELYGVPDVNKNANSWLARTYVAKGAEAFNNKDFATASDIFAKGYAADPTNTDLALNLAKSYAEMGNLEDAARIYMDIMGLTHSKYAEAVAQAREELGYYQTIDISKALGDRDYATADRLIDEILTSDPDNSVVNMLLIQSATNQKNWSKVIANGEKAASLQVTDENKSEAYFLLGAAYQNTENKDKAIENYRKVTAGPNVANAKAQIAALNK